MDRTSFMELMTQMSFPLNPSHGLLVWGSVGESVDSACLQPTVARSSCVQEFVHVDCYSLSQCSSFQ